MNKSTKKNKVNVKVVRSVRAVKQPVVRPSVFRNRSRADIVRAIQNVIFFSLKRPLFLLTVVISVYLITSSAGDIDSGPMSKFFPANSTNAAVKWVRTNEKKFFGLLAFSGVVADAPPAQRATYAIIIFSWVLLVPESTVNEYYFQAVLLHLYMHLRDPTHKLIIVGVAAFAYFAGFLFNHSKDEEATVSSPIDATTVAPVTVAPVKK